MPVIHRWVPLTLRQVFHECPLKPMSSDQAKASDDKSSTGLKFVIGRLLRWHFRPMAVYPPIAPNTFRWFRLPTGNGPSTLPCDAVEPPTTRQIGDSPAFKRIVIGVWSVGYREHRTPINGSSAFNRRFSRTQVFITNKSECDRLLFGGCHVCNRNVTSTFCTW